MFVFINTFLHIFGWAFVLKLNEMDEIIRIYPARVKFRGFKEESMSKAYAKLTEYMALNSKTLFHESKDK